MSRVITWFTVVFDDSLDEAWFPDPLFDEEDTNRNLASLQISIQQGKRERHLRYKLEQPLTAAQLQALAELKAQGLFSNFYVVDEITTESVE
jgi:hypothetical protein